MSRSIGVILLCVFLALYGLFAISNFHLQFEGFILGVTAIAAAIFLALGK